MLDVRRELEELYGSAEPPRGVVHIMHVARSPQGLLGALRIGDPATPKSASDFFVVNAERAHADAVLTSAENLRREPELQHALQGPWAHALTRYRRDTLAKHAPLTCAILTRSGELPDPHPVWSDGTDKLIFMPEQALAAAAPHGARIVRIADLDAVSAARWLITHGLATISVEAGPKTVRALYEANAVDELWLTHWESVTKDAAFAGMLPDDDTLFRGLTLLGSSLRSEGGHTFRFERWVRAR